MPRRPTVDVMTVRLGDLVRSSAGRDRGTDLMVVAVLDDRHVRVADGRLRPIDGAKRKNVRHLESLGLTCARLAERLAGGEPVADIEVRRAIAALLASKEVND